MHYDDMSHEGEKTINTDVFQAVADKFSAVAQASLHSDDPHMPIEINKEGIAEVMQLQQYADPELSLTLARPSLTETHHSITALVIEYAVYLTVDETEDETDSLTEPEVTERRFFAFDNGSIEEAFTIDGKKYSRSLGEGEKADIIALVESATPVM